MRIVITGASGNLGTALLRRLLVDGYGHELVGVVRRVPPAEPPYDRVDWHSVDLTDESAADTLTDVVAGADAVVHLAWGFQPSHDPDYLERLGVGGTAAVLDAVRRAGVPHLVHMSSVGAYAHRQGAPAPVDESWPATGIPTSMYSRHKAAAERLLDEHERLADDGVPTVTRLRPGFVLQRDAASGLLRYGVPPYVPARALRWLPVLPLDRSLLIPVVHADDVADAITRVLHRRPGGAFNLAAEPPVSARHISRALGARLVHLPSAVLGAVVEATWRARLQQLDRGWIDLAFSVPLLDTRRARDELGWTPQVDAVDALVETVTAMQEAASKGSPPLRKRSTLDELVQTVRTRRPIGSRRKP